MANQTSAALRRAIRLAAKADPSEVTDRELLHRFTAEGDQAAFATLVGRHAGMVLGVCRRALPTLQDAEDTVQATFLILAQKAARVRWQASVANYLYATARKVARNALVSARRRTGREIRVAAPESISDVDRMTAWELFGALDEELDRLPPHYREPLVLCYLEGLTRDEAAGRLGVPLDTLKTRLKRARKRLGETLAGRGLIPVAGLMALTALAAEASPPRLIEDIMATTTGTPSAAVVVLVRGFAMNEGFKRSVLALAALIVVFALGMGWGVLSPGTSGQEQAQKPAKPDADKSQPWTVSGHVLAPDGRPLAAAKLFFMRQGDQPSDGGLSGPDGRFQIEVPAAHEAVVLVARADGFGVGFLLANRTERDREVEVKTVKDLPIRGRVVDEEGRPVKKVEVTVTRVSVYADDSLESFFTELKKQPPYRSHPMGVRYLGAYAGSVFEPKADGNGHFTIPGVGAERRVTLSVGGEGRARYYVHVVTRAGFDPKPLNQELDEKMQKLEEHWYEHPLSGPDFTVATEAEKPIRGAVKDSQTGRPKAGVKLWISANGYDQPRPWPPEATATTDAMGRFEIRSARKSKAYHIRVEADPTAGHLKYDAWVQDTPDHEPITADVVLMKGVVVTGKVIDAGTKRAVPGFVSVGVLAGNPYAEDFPGFETMYWERGATGEDGVFRIVTIPGPVILFGGPNILKLPEKSLGILRYKSAVPDPNYPQCFKSDRLYPGSLEFVGHKGTYQIHQGTFCKVLDIKPEGEVVREDVIAVPCPVVEVKVCDDEGRPLAGAMAAGLTLGGVSPLSFEKDVGLAQREPGRPRLITFWEPTRKLFGTLFLKGDEKDEAVVRLGKGGTIKGRLLDENKQPLAGVKVIVRHREPSAGMIQGIAHRTGNMGVASNPITTPTTGEDGTFRAEGVVPGVKFGLSFAKDGQGFDLVQILEDRSVRPGETHDFGDVQVKPKP